MLRKLDGYRVNELGVMQLLERKGRDLERKLLLLLLLRLLLLLQLVLVLLQCMRVGKSLGMVELLLRQMVGVEFLSRVGSRGAKAGWQSGEVHVFPEPKALKFINTDLLLFQNFTVCFFIVMAAET